jgi:hypothetical protein
VVTVLVPVAAVVPGGPFTALALRIPLQLPRPRITSDG